MSPEMRAFCLLITLALAHCRPSSTKPEDDAVQVEKHEVVEVPQAESRTLLEEVDQKKKVVQETKDILAKIAQVNKNHGMTASKGLKADYVEIQTPSLASRSQDYLKQKEENYMAQRGFLGYQQPPQGDFLDGYQTPPQTNLLGYQSPTTDPSDGTVKKEDEIPGHFIKRKITATQTFLVPAFFPIAFVPMQVPTLANKSQLEKQTVDNVKSIVVNFQVPPQFQPFQSGYQSLYYDHSPFERQQITSPFTEFFPIVIKDPIMQMINAFATMIEYGPQGNPLVNACKGQRDDDPKQQQSSRSGKLLNHVGEGRASLNYNINNKDPKNPSITIFGAENPNPPPENELNQTVLDIEDLQINDNPDSPVKFSFKADSFDWADGDRDAKTKKETKRVVVIKPGDSSRGSPPIRDHPQDVDDDDSVEETGIVLDSQIVNDDPKHSNSHHKKLISKDNTGSGIFIHKLKVRKGGVAIAGPGGIATAGSGGTAIVGPNGFAYTHPDSVAIAGSGSKVIAVDPMVSLSDALQSQNKTRKDGFSPRVGKVVAVGPVIYYNRGDV